MATINDVIAKHASSLMDTPGVTAVGQGEVDGKECIVVMLEQDLPEIRETILSKLEGYPVSFEISGIIQAQQEPLTPL